MTDEALPSATRRVKLLFDKDGDPLYPGVKSPECFTPKARGVLPPRDVIPVIFVPGIAGTNLRRKEKGKEEVWVPPAALEVKEAVKAFRMANRSPKERQRLFELSGVEVSPNGKCPVADTTYWLDEKEAKRRGWGEVIALSYNALLQRLEVTLNDQCTRPGFTEERGNFLLEEIGMFQYLYEGGPATSITQKDKKADAKRRVTAYSNAEKFIAKPDYAKLAKETVKAWERAPRVLTAEEIARLDDYYYPVWAHGYNWLGDPELAAEGLVKKIGKVLKHYEKGKYFRHQGKVILVTHSMGGLIARRAAQIDDSKILGVVHGVCPLVGAAVLYRRLRAGQEGGGISENAAAAIMGNTQAEMTVQLGCSPGAFTLAPTKNYRPYWLKCCMTDKDTYENMAFSLPHSDPYTEIYAKTTDDVWWGMVDPKLLDPLGVMTEKKGRDTPIEAYNKAITKARDFHERLKLYAHPETYGFYGTDNSKYRSFGSVTWVRETKGRFAKYDNEFIKTRYPDKASWQVFETAQADKFFMQGDHSGEALALIPDQTTGKSNEILFRLSEYRNEAGDGTVPACSGGMLQELTPPLKEVFGIPGYDHQAAFDNTYAYRATIYCIARIIQKAAPPPEENFSCAAPKS